MKIVCISLVASEGKWWRHITPGRKYKCVDVIYNDESNIKYKIIDDSGVENIYSSKNFIADWEIRDKKLNELGV